ncbi:hypothetical protein [Streptosporangium sp. KLBMP 9127]|nr:hypothetical protein [Streptosporangium sp. KLBMP 9127]
MRDALPRLLVSPPWERKAPSVPGLKPPTERAVVWEPGEREEWRKQLTGRALLRVSDWADGWEGAVRAFQDGQITREPAVFSLFGQGPEELVRPLLADWRPALSRTSDFSVLRAVTVRFEVDAHHVVFPNAKKHGSGWALMPYLDVDVARLMALWLRKPPERRHARAWFARHGPAAVPYLVPDALGARGVPRDKAAAALIHIASRCGDAAVVEAARQYGEQAAVAVEQLLDGGGPADRPRKVSWLNWNLLPEVRLKDGRALPPEAVENLVGALILCPGVLWDEPAESYPGLEDALDQCDRESLGAFGWAVFGAWMTAGTPFGNGWVIDQLIWLADDEVVGRLGALALNSPASMAKHLTGMLGDIGTEAALAQLDHIAQRAKPGLRRTAKERAEWATR